MKTILITIVLLLGTIACQDSDDFLGVQADAFYSNSQLQNYANFGAHFVIEEAVQAKSLTSSNYKIAEIYSIRRQQSGDLTNLTFDISLANEEESAFRAIFSISYDESSESHTVTSYAYDTDKTLNGLVIGALASLPARLSSSSGSSLNNTPFAQETPSLKWTGDAWPGKDSQVDQNGERVLGGRRRLTLEAFNTSPKIQGMFIFGLENILGAIVPKNLAESQFKLANILSITQQVVAGVNYNFDVEVENSDGVTIKLNFTVFDQVWSETQRISSYSYTISDSESGTVITGEGPY